MRLEIKNRWTGTVIVEGDFTSLAELVSDAVRRRADLSRADLSGADLIGADLSGANLIGADLSGADLSGANLIGATLIGADLSRADLIGADLSGANLSGANLSRADLIGADLSGANLSGANLIGATLIGANLSRADLTPIRDDIWAVLSASPAEVPALLKALREGRVDGSQYSGECACLIGTLANTKGCDYRTIPGLKPNSDRPSEIWFLPITIGSVPEKNQHSKLAIEWVEQWLTMMRAAAKAGAFDETSEVAS